jgi:hypothetical protein
MTDGYALRFNRFMDVDGIDDVKASSYDIDSKTLWHGIFFNGAHSVKTLHLDAYGQGDGITILGLDGTSNSDLWITDSRAVLNNNDVHLAGGFGGLYLNHDLIYQAANRNLLIDDEINGVPTGVGGNREIIADSSTVFDGNHSTPILIELNDSLSSGASLTLDALVGSAGASGANLKVGSWPNGKVAINSGLLFNSLGDAVDDNDPTTVVTIGSNVHCANNSGYCGNASSPTTNFSSSAKAYGNGQNGNGPDYAPNTGIGWLAYKPVLGCLNTSGVSISVRSSSISWQKTGYKTVQYLGAVTVGTVTGGKCATAITMSLPFSSATRVGMSAGKDATTGSALNLEINPAVSAAQALVTTYNDTVPANNGEVLMFNFTVQTP